MSVYAHRHNHQDDDHRALRILRKPALLLVLAILVMGSVVFVGKHDRTGGSGALAATPATFTADAYKYARCMRDRGVTGFPNPTMTNHDGQAVAYLDPSTKVITFPRYGQATQVCGVLLPSPTTAPGSAQP